MDSEIRVLSDLKRGVTLLYAVSKPPSSMHLLKTHANYGAIESTIELMTLMEKLAVYYFYFIYRL